MGATYLLYQIIINQKGAFILQPKEKYDTIIGIDAKDFTEPKTT